MSVEHVMLPAQQGQGAWPLGSCSLVNNGYEPIEVVSTSRGWKISLDVENCSANISSFFWSVYQEFELIFSKISSVTDLFIFWLWKILNFKSLIFLKHLKKIK